MRSKLILQNQALVVSLAADRKPMQYIIPLITCAALIIEYQDKISDQPMLLLAHLPSGSFREQTEADSDAELAVYALPTIAKADSIRPQYWGGGVVRDSGNLNEPDIALLSKTLAAEVKEVERASSVLVTVNSAVTIQCTGKSQFSMSLWAAPMAAKPDLGCQAAKPELGEGAKSCCAIM